MMVCFEVQISRHISFAGFKLVSLNDQLSPKYHCWRESGDFGDRALTRLLLLARNQGLKPRMQLLPVVSFTKLSHR
jgi:hypothetical protein